MQAARLGSNVTMAGKVGKDDFGAKVLSSVSQAGVDISKVSYSDTFPTAIGNVLLEVNDQKISNRIIVVPGANMDIAYEDVAFLKETITQYDMVILQLEIPKEIDILIAKIAYDAGVPVMLNPAPAIPLEDEFLSYLTYISPNEHEASILTGVSITNEETAKRAIDVLIGKGVKNVLITLGSRGAAFGNSNEYFIKPCVDYGKVIDPTAAGGSFVGAFCTSVCLGGISYEDAVNFANFTAAITVSRMGAQPSLPTISQVLSFMSQRGFDTSAWEVLF